MIANSSRASIQPRLKSRSLWFPRPLSSPHKHFPQRETVTGKSFLTHSSLKGGSLGTPKEELIKLTAVYTTWQRFNRMFFLKSFIWHFIVSQNCRLHNKWTAQEGGGKGGNGAVWKWTELSHSNFALVGMCLSDWIWSEISHVWCRITKQHLQSHYQVGTRSTSPPQVVMTPNTSGHYPSALFSPETSFPLPLATNALSPFREEDNTGTHSFSAILMHPRKKKKTINRQYTPYYSECLEIIFFPLARPVLIYILQFHPKVVVIPISTHL